MTTSLPNLRPQSMGELLDQALRLYRRHFAQFVGVFAIPLIPVIVLQALGSLANALPLAMSLREPDTSFNPAMPLASLVGFFAQTGSALLTGVLLQGVASPALVRAIANAWFGLPVTIGGTYRQLGAMWAQLLVAAILSFVIAYAITFWWLVPCIGWLTGLGMSMFFGLVVNPLAIPVLILEKRTAFDLFRRAWDLARRRFWWLMSFAALVYVFAQAVMGGPSVLLMAALFGSIPLFVQSEDPTLFVALQTAIPSIVNTLTILVYYPLLTITMTLVYLDLRVRTEGLDLALLAESVAGDFAMAKSRPAAEVAADAPPPQKGRLVTQRELAHFALLSLIPLSLIGALMALLFLALLGPAYF
jgi:hypothetical protein